jgi:uncharacterized repeat protein (TIGR03803 family)
MNIRLCSLVMTVALLLAAQTAGYAQTFSVVYDFGTQAGDPLFPQASGVIAQGRDGNLYSTAVGGMGSGAVFKITPKGTLSVIYDFNGAHGYSPVSGLTLGTDGNFYGATLLGGASDEGTLFKITPNGKWTLLHNFGDADGAYVNAPPIEGADGNFYGTTQYGPGNTSGNGIVYKLTPSGQFTTLYAFDGTHGERPYAPLVQGTDGNFYGTTFLGGTYGAGTVFKITGKGQITTLYSFDGPHGRYPFDALVQGTDGSFYGTTGEGGIGCRINNGCGVVFKITRDGVLTVLHTFSYSGGAAPLGGLVEATDGNFYGATESGGTLGYGAIFRITSKGNLTFVHDFDSTDGSNPQVTLLQHTTGVLYGDTYSGGTSGGGVFYSLNGNFAPYAGLVSTSGKVGKTIGILGQGFTGTTEVSFDGTSSQFTVVSDTYLEATVPNGATTGFVIVTTPGGPLKSNKKFQVK